MASSEAPALTDERFAQLADESLQRTLALYGASYGSLANSDNVSFESLRLRLAVKVNDDYAAVKDLPPPPAPQAAAGRAPAAAKAAATTTTTTASGFAMPEARAPKRSAAAVGGGAATAAPAAAGAVVSEDADDDDDGQSQAKMQRMIRNMPATAGEQARGRSGPSMSGAVVAYHATASTASTAAISSDTGRALVERAQTAPPPTWHAPWKLKRVIPAHVGWVRSIAVDPSNEWFATGSNDRTIRIWRLAEGELRLTLTGHVGVVRGLAISARHPYLFSVGDDKTVRCWDLESNKVVRKYHGHLQGVFAVALHPTLDLLVTGGRDGVAIVWDMRTRRDVFKLAGHKSAVMSLAAQGVDPQVISGSADATVRLWDLAAGKTQAILTNHKKGVRSLAVHPREFSFASASRDNIKKWAMPDGTFLHNFAGHNAIVNALALNADNVLCSAADNGSLCFWDWRSGHCFQRLATIPQPGSLDSEAGIFDAKFDMTGSRLITAECDKTIKVYAEDDSATPDSHPITGWNPSLIPDRF